MAGAFGSLSVNTSKIPGQLIRNLYKHNIKKPYITIQSYFKGAD